MRKNINKIIAFAIGISVMSGSVVPALAADSTQQTTTSTSTAKNSQIVNGKPLLTLDEAVKEAISISEILQLDTSKITYQDKTNDLNEDLDDSKDVSGDEEDFNDDTREVSANKARQQRDFDQDLLIYKVTKKYNDMVTSQMEIDKASKNLEIKKKELKDAQLRGSLGMTIPVDLKATQLEIEKLENKQKSSESALKDAQYSFKVLTGKDVTQYSLEQDVKFEPLKIDGSVDKYLDNSIESYIKYSEQLVKLNKDYYDKEYVDDNKLDSKDVNAAKDAIRSAQGAYDEARNDTSGKFTEDDIKNKKDILDKAKTDYTSKISARITYLKTKLDNYESETSLNENKKAFKDNLKTYYTNLLASEDNINTYKKNIEVYNEKLKNYKLQYDLGMITESTYNGYVLNSIQDEIDLRNEIISYNTLKQEIQKPWIAFSGAK
ncbi:MAG: TolC family protein [Clostridium beijerinckii]|jgi:hypothetical protein|nr:TolC family protein [Clostridium beijerinckii]MCI1586142.1 TolC family protein [Clostridium beijerinckii]MCI1624179.1 TolC family protein [Clostridium beijerinckii]